MENYVIGHARVLAYFDRVGAERFAHTTLFVGPEGVGKQVLASVAAARLVGCAPDEVAHHPRVIFVRAGVHEKTGARRAAISVDLIRELKPLFAVQRTEAVVVIIERGEELNAESGNALLKVMEEPNMRLYFMILAQSEESVLPTIQSRAACIRCAPVPLVVLRDALRARGYASDAIEEILPLAEGLPGRAISFLRDASARERVRREHERFEAMLATPLFAERMKLLADLFEKKENHIEARHEIRELLQWWMVWLAARAPSHTAIARMAHTMPLMLENMHPRLLVERVVLAL